MRFLGVLGLCVAAIFASCAAPSIDHSPRPTATSAPSAEVVAPRADGPAPAPDAGEDATPEPVASTTWPLREDPNAKIPKPSEGDCEPLPPAQPDDWWARAIEVTLPFDGRLHHVVWSGQLVQPEGRACPHQRWVQASCVGLRKRQAAALYRELVMADLPKLKARTASGPGFSWEGVTWITVHAAGKTCDVVLADWGDSSVSDAVLRLRRLIESASASAP